MSTTKEYLDYVMENLPEECRSRAMMGEYLVYYMDKLIGGIYDNRLLLKPVNAVKEFLPDAPYELPYEGAKLMPMVENIDDRELLGRLIEAMYDELPAPKPKKTKKQY